MELNTREVAILIWVAAILIGCLAHPNIRPSLFSGVRAFFRRKIVAFVLLLYVYLGLIVAALHAVGLWDWGQLKITLIFSVLIGIASLFRLPRVQDDPRFYRHWIADNLRIIVATEFIVAFYKFPLAVELALIPLLALFVGMPAVGERYEKYKAAVGHVNALLMTFGVIVIGYALYAMASRSGSFWPWQMLRDFYALLLLSLLLLPFVQVVCVYTAYENVFVRLDAALPDRGLSRYAKRRAIFVFRRSLVLLDRWGRYVAKHHPQDRSGIDDSFEEILKAHYRERHPPEVARSEGWSPYKAKDFLQDEGLATGSYDRSFDEWFASSPYKELGDEVMPDNVAYYIEGDERVAKRLKLVLNVNNPENRNESEFLRLVQLLSNQAIGEHQLADDTGDFERHVEGKRITMRRTDWQGGIPGGYDIRFKIEAD